jgi:hypothetical protein
MILEILVILALMAVDFPFTVAPSVAWGMGMGFSPFQLGVFYLCATLVSCTVYFFMLRKSARKFKVYHVIGKYKQKGEFYSVFLGNMLAHNFDASAAASANGIGYPVTMAALLVSNAVYFVTVWLLVALVVSLVSGLLAQVVVSAVLVAALWTAAAHFVLYKLGFGWK